MLKIQNDLNQFHVTNKTAIEQKKKAVQTLEKKERNKKRKRKQSQTITQRFILSSEFAHIHIRL